jgi:hypothetical protein
MPTDTLGDEVQAVLKSASEFIRLNRPDDKRRRGHLLNLEAIEERLRADIDERESAYANELQLKEDAQIDAKWRELNEDQRFVRVNAEQKARQQTFETLRQVNDGGYLQCFVTNQSAHSVLHGVVVKYSNYAFPPSITTNLRRRSGGVSVGMGGAALSAASTSSAIVQVL